MPDMSEIERPDEEALIEQVRSLTQKEKWKNAIYLLQPLRERGELSIEGLKTLAYCYSRDRDYANATSIYEKLIGNQPHELMYYYYVAYQYRMMDKGELAIEKYEKCLELFPKFLKVYLELGPVFEEQGYHAKALKAYREGIQAYKEMSSSQQKNYVLLYSRLCTQAARLLISSFHIDESIQNEIEFYFKESISCEPQDPHTWYRLGDFLLKMGRLDEALEYLNKAQSIAPQIEYIPHKIAQALLQKDQVEKAYETYKRIPSHKRTAYILNGMGHCALQIGSSLEAARYFFKAAIKEPAKFYHYRDLGLALIELGDRDQATENLEKANLLYKKEHREDHNKILAKIEEIQDMPQNDRIVLEEPGSPVSTISHGIIVKYRSDKGFGFIKDNNDAQDVFFHITCVKNRVAPVEGHPVKFVREVGDKGPQASKVWIENST